MRLKEKIKNKKPNNLFKKLFLLIPDYSLFLVGLNVSIKYNFIITYHYLCSFLVVWPRNKFEKSAKHILQMT